MGSDSKWSDVLSGLILMGALLLVGCCGQCRQDLIEGKNTLPEDHPKRDDYCINCWLELEEVRLEYEEKLGRVEAGDLSPYSLSPYGCTCPREFPPDYEVQLEIFDEAGVSVCCWKETLAFWPVNPERCEHTKTAYAVMKPGAEEPIYCRVKPCMEEGVLKLIDTTGSTRYLTNTPVEVYEIPVVVTNKEETADIRAVWKVVGRNFDKCEAQEHDWQYPEGRGKCYYENN